MQAVLIIVHLLVAVALVTVVLMQRSEGGALGMGGGGSGLGGLFSPRGAGDTLTKTTAILGLLFFLTSAALTLLTLGARQQPNSILNAIVPGTAAPANPSAPPTLPSRAATPPTLPGKAPASPAPAAPTLPSVPQTR